MSDTLALTQDLIARRSVTPADEGCQEVMSARLAAAGFEVERLRYGIVDNIWARRGTSARHPTMTRIATAFTTGK